MTAVHPAKASARPGWPSRLATVSSRRRMARPAVSQRSDPAASRAGSRGRAPTDGRRAGRTGSGSPTATTSAPMVRAAGQPERPARPHDRGTGAQVCDRDEALDQDHGPADGIGHAVVRPEQVQACQLAHRPGRDVVDGVREGGHRDERADRHGPARRRERDRRPCGPGQHDDEVEHECAERWGGGRLASSRSPSSHGLARHAMSASSTIETVPQTSGWRRIRITAPGPRRPRRRCR